MEAMYYAEKDFAAAPKFDAHIHYHVFDDYFARKAAQANMRLLAINTNLDFDINTQFAISKRLVGQHPRTFAFLGCFDAAAFSDESFVDVSIERIKVLMAAGACGIKIWKNIGMSLKNSAGGYVMADDAAFAPIFAFMEREQIPLLAHLGESRNCWLPFSAMSVADDVRYYRAHPEYHLYSHPEVPDYEMQIAARDRLLARYPALVFVGAHMGSMEWSVEEIARRLERFPNFYVDISACFGHIAVLAERDRTGLSAFFTRYSHRIIYGSDFFVERINKRRWMGVFCRCFPRLYMKLLFMHAYRTFRKHWLFFATDRQVATGKSTGGKDFVQGLKLSKSTVNSIFYDNACAVFIKNNNSLADV